MTELPAESENNGKIDKQAEQAGMWLFLIAVVTVVLLIGLLMPDDEPEKKEPEAFSHEDCLEQSWSLLEENPSLFITRQQAYDACRDAETVVDLLRGEIVEPRK